MFKSAHFCVPLFVRYYFETKLPNQETWVILLRVKTALRKPFITMKANFCPHPFEFSSKKKSERKQVHFIWTCFTILPIHPSEYFKICLRVLSAHSRAHNVPYFVANCATRHILWGHCFQAYSIKRGSTEKTF